MTIIAALSAIAARWSNRSRSTPIRSHRLAGTRKSVPQGHLIVAHYEVVGNGVKDSSVPEGLVGHC
jgi:hypothetical protein